MYFSLLLRGDCIISLHSCIRHTLAPCPLPTVTFTLSRNDTTGWPLPHPPHTPATLHAKALSRRSGNPASVTVPRQPSLPFDTRPSGNRQVTHWPINSLVRLQTPSHRALCIVKVHEHSVYNTLTLHSLGLFLVFVLLLLDWTSARFHAF